VDLPTYTNIWRIEKRLYKLYDFRLPAPLPITWIGVFVGITVPYVVFLIIIGLPFNHTLVWLYVLPPGVLTWLTTRPVIEGKRLPELVTSQVRYMTEPRAWCRMAPFAEKDEILVSARVWHAHPPKVRPKKTPARARPGISASQADSTNVADARPPFVAGRVASPAVAAPARDPVVPPSAHLRVPARASARASARPEAIPVKEAPRAKLAWSPWPRGSGPATGAPEPTGDHASVPYRQPAWMIAPSHAAGTPDPGTLEVPHDSEPLSDPSGPPTASCTAMFRPESAADSFHKLTTPESVPRPSASSSATAEVSSWGAVAAAIPGLSIDAPEPKAEPPKSAAKAPEPMAEAAQLRAEAPGTIIVTFGQLRGIRGWWRKLAPAAAALRELGVTGQADQVAAIAYAIGAARFAVKIPCITCSTPTPVDVGIGDPGNPEPSGVVCGTCRAESGEQALAGPAGRPEASWRYRVKVMPVGQGPGKQDQEALHRERARLPLAGPRRIAVLGCTRGAGQTLTVQMTGHVLASLRGAAIAAVDLNPGAASLAARRAPAVSVRALLAGRPPDERASGSDARLEVVADLPGTGVSGLDPDDYQRLASLLAARYLLTVIDPAPGSLDRVLPTADQLVLVVPARPDAATSLASTQQWLDAHGYGELAGRAVTVVNGVSRRTMEDVLRAESVARDRCQAIIRVPWDDLLFARPGPPPVLHPHRALNPQTRIAYTALAGVLVAALAEDSAYTADGRNPGEHSH
jgi:MinD-like ATPase involved in chromosome partitioning or flagellar assembly